MPFITFLMGPIGRYILLAIMAAAFGAGCFYKGFSTAESIEKGKAAEALHQAQVEASKKAKEDNDANLQLQKQRDAYKAKNAVSQKKFDDLLAKMEHNAVCDDPEAQAALNEIIRNANIK